MKYNFDRLPTRNGSNCIKYDARLNIFGREDVIPMWIADMDFELAPCIMEALRKRLEHPVLGYGTRPEGFYNSVIDWVRRRNGWEMERKWIEFTPGVVSGFTLAILAFSGEGDGVVIQPPVYPPFAAAINDNRRRVVNNPLVHTGTGYRVDFDDLDRKLEQARLLLFCNPHNPTGHVFTREELLRIGELCRRHDVLIISDEIHSDLIYKPNRHTHIASLSDDLASRTVTLMAPSKTFNIAGLSTSLAVIPDDTLRRRFRSEIDRLHIGLGNVFGTVALEAGYTDCEDWLEEMLEYVDGNRHYVASFLKENAPRIGVFIPQSTYMLWLDMRGLGMEHRAMLDFLANEAGLGLNDGLEFGEEGRGFARMNLATSRAVIEQAMKQLGEALDKRGLGK